MRTCGDPGPGAGTERTLLLTLALALAACGGARDGMREAGPADGPLRFSDLDYGYPVHVALEDPRVAYVDVGEGPQTLVLIHGLASNLGFWRYNIPALAERHRVVAVDLPGYGRSEKRDEYPYGPGFFAETVRDLVAELGLEDVTLVGHSMGGQVAMTAAVRYPEVVDRLVLVDPAGIESFTAEEGAALRSIYTVEGIRATPEPVIRRNLALNFHEWDERLEWMVEERRRLAGSDEFDRFAHAVVRSLAGMLDEPTTPLLEEIEQPTLLVYGEHDALIPNRYLHPDSTTAGVFDGGAERIPNATVVPLEDAGHLAMMERPEAFAEVVLRWLGGR